MRLLTRGKCRKGDFVMIYVGEEMIIFRQVMLVDMGVSEMAVLRPCLTYWCAAKCCLYLVYYHNTWKMLCLQSLPRCLLKRESATISF